jgi:hypothetical protein
VQARQQAEVVAVALQRPFVQVAFSDHTGLPRQQTPPAWKPSTGETSAFGGSEAPRLEAHLGRRWMPPAGMQFRCRPARPPPRIAATRSPSHASVGSPAVSGSSVYREGADREGQIRTRGGRNRPPGKRVARPAAGRLCHRQHLRGQAAPLVVDPSQ